MADPLSITASVLAVATAAFVSTKTLIDTVNRFKGRDKTLQRLQDELEDLLKILEMLQGISQCELSILALLEGPVRRCSELCLNFDKSMKDFTGKATKTGFRDWAKLEFRRGDINEFIDTVSGYKSTISVGLGAINLNVSKASQQILEQYSEMIEDTTYNLNLRLQRIDDKIALLPQKTADSSDTSIDLNNERAVTERCLSICENARSYLESLTDQEPLSQPKSPQEYPMDQQETFEAQRLTRQLLGQNRDSIAEMVGRLRERLESIPPDGNPANGHERTRLQQELNLSKQCLEVCKMASVEVTRQKCHTIGEAIADGDSDQVLVTTFADLFNIGKAESRGKSAQLIGSMRDETLQRISDGRYGSRFGALPSTEASAPLLQSPVEVQRTKEDPSRQETAEGGRSMATRPYKPNSYQVRSRRPDGRAGTREEGEE
ncbi:hypothetical protein CH063_05783 [Colletotrichum higginsianum]|uniref:Azaphilone pigments biosynthesis cluster protein L N-terminal domain-containing protein n=1 Tax=Colletotrichum higginsianum (strain IMI 349063) TaxID=759273 RepID=H1V076_COLHI|nr:uncharacterized protein CH63R_09731 [Colletotrichum higginsianum IMI 349063]OBR05611.1 hypothetical protein CH63R_09731 [Colletotrichum higginsianum IMI 349063]CCF33627.1 hypothetical protein CH063_05783 [Colletotrichum higginsianum]